MRLPGHPGVHLTYCLNIHKGETWAENFAAVRDKALAVKALVCPDRPFGLGLRLSNAASLQLADARALAEFRAFLHANGLYVFTVNGFPYGEFHGTRVKENAYRPDWSDPRRLEYTNRLADILAALLPEGVPGSISTVPIGYGKYVANKYQIGSSANNLMKCAVYLNDLSERFGKEITVALEPEPDCFFETTEETIPFLAWQNKFEVFSHRRIGVCVDLCHQAVEFEDPAASLSQLLKAGVAVPKVQLSAALRLSPTRAARRRLMEFKDPVYLHQLKVRTAEGKILSYADLDDAPDVRTADAAPGEEWRVHFHVPLYFSEFGELRSTADAYTPALAKLLASGAVPHLEIETYTFDVLPAAAREPDVVRSIAREYAWALAWLNS